MSNVKDDITHLELNWQKLIAIDPDFKDIHIPPENTGKTLKESWYKNKFNIAYGWAKSVRRTPNIESKNAQIKAEKIIKLTEDMEKKREKQGYDKIQNT